MSRGLGDVYKRQDFYPCHQFVGEEQYLMGNVDEGITKPEIVKETPISAVIDGHDGMGQLLGHKAMEMAIEKAKKSGVGIVSVRNSNHYGIAGYYAKMASDQGLIGFSCTNSEAIMVPVYARKAMLGSNPIAWTVPADPVDFFFDCSTTVVTRGKLEMYNKMGKATPDGWAVNKDGVPSTDAAEVLGNISRHEGGGILPLGCLLYTSPSPRDTR